MAAGLALVARAAVHRMFTVHRSGKYLRNTRLARSPCAAEQVGVADAA